MARPVVLSLNILVAGSAFAQSGADSAGAVSWLSRHAPAILHNLLASVLWWGIPLVIVGIFYLVGGPKRISVVRDRMRAVKDVVVPPVGKEPQVAATLGVPVPPPEHVPNIRAWNLPFNRNPNFTGREDVLKSLQAGLKSGGTAALTAIHGLGGIGKTQTAVEFAWRNAAAYDVVWWVRAQEPALLLGDFGNLAEKLGLADAQTRKADEVRGFVREWFRTNARWLVVFDNAEKPDDIREWLPQGPGHVVITSRWSAWKGIVEPLRLDVWPESDAVEFLCKRTDCEDRSGAAELAHELGSLPLATEQAAAYIEATGNSFSEYLRKYRERST